MVKDTGISVLYEPPKGVTIIADIVFVHGLNGHRERTWTWNGPRTQSSSFASLRRRFLGRKPKSSNVKDTEQVPEEILEMTKFWPRDFLPDDLPDCRILTWGYNVDLRLVRDDTSTAAVNDHARNLLSNLADERTQDEQKQRPLIFLSHSLGGIVVKDALCVTQESNNYLKDILTATIGVCFFGTPHRGSPRASTAETLFRASQLWGNAPNLKVLQALRYDAETLKRVHNGFRALHEARSFKLRSFHEGLDYKGIKIVERLSSNLDILGEESTDIEANHMEMTKFSSKNDPGYVATTRTLKRWLKDRTDSQKLDQKLVQELSQDCIDSLTNSERAGRFGQVDEALKGTLDWLYSDKVSFSSWLSGNQSQANPIYWINGKPGSGKSTIVKHAVQSPQTTELLQKTSPGVWSILSFFFYYGGYESQRTIHGLLEDLVFQLVYETPQLALLIYHIRLKSLTKRRGGPFEGSRFMKGMTWTNEMLIYASSTLTKALEPASWTYEALEEAFEIIISQSDIKLKTCIFIDALDEHEGEHERLLKMIEWLQLKLANTPSAVKICISSRPEPAFRVAFASYPGFRVHHHTKEAISVYARTRLTSVTSEQLDDSDVDQLRDLAIEVANLAEGVFIWVKMVVDELRNESIEGATIEELRVLLDVLPPDLEAMYRRILGKRKPGHAQEFHRMCHILLAALSPLSLRDLMLATHVSLYNHWQNASRQKLIQRLESRTGGLIEVSEIPRSKSEDRVQFIHRTFKDFLRKTKVLPEQTLSSTELGLQALFKTGIYIETFLAEPDRETHRRIYNDTMRYARGMERSSPESSAAIEPILDKLLGKMLDNDDSQASKLHMPRSIGSPTWWLCNVAATDFNYRRHDINRTRGVLIDDIGQSVVLTPKQAALYDLTTLAAERGLLRYVRSKVTQGVRTHYLGLCPLLWSVVNGLDHDLTAKVDAYLDLLQMLVDRGAKIDASWNLVIPPDEAPPTSFERFEHRNSALGRLMACYVCYASAIRPNPGLVLDLCILAHWFLSNHVEVNRSYCSRQIPDTGNHLRLLLHFTMISENPKTCRLEEMWKLLLMYGARLGWKDDLVVERDHDHSPLLWLAITTNRYRLVQLICRAGADPRKVWASIATTKSKREARRMQRLLKRYPREAGTGQKAKGPIPRLTPSEIREMLDQESSEDDTHGDYLDEDTASDTDEEPDERSEAQKNMEDWEPRPMSLYLDACMEAKTRGEWSYGDEKGKSEDDDERNEGDDEEDTKVSLLVRSATAKGQSFRRRFW